VVPVCLSHPGQALMQSGSKGGGGACILIGNSRGERKRWGGGNAQENSDQETFSTFLFRTPRIVPITPRVGA